MNFPNFLEGLTFFAKQSFRTGKIPKIFKITKIVPIDKVKNPSQFNHLRPVGITNFVMILLEKVYVGRVIEHINKLNKLSEFQFGCRKYHSTEHAMIQVVDNIKKEISKGKVSVLVSLDLKNAFPSVHREKFLVKMKEEFQVSDYWLRDYFQDRKQFVEINIKKIGSDSESNRAGTRECLRSKVLYVLHK